MPSALLLDELELVGADAADLADEVLGQLESSGSSGVSTVTSQPQTVQRNVYFFSSAMRVSSQLKRAPLALT